MIISDQPLCQKGIGFSTCSTIYTLMLTILLVKVTDKSKGAGIFKPFIFQHLLPYTATTTEKLKLKLSMLQINVCDLTLSFDGASIVVFVVSPQRGVEGVSAPQVVDESS